MQMCSDSKELRLARGWHDTPADLHHVWIISQTSPTVADPPPPVRPAHGSECTRRSRSLVGALPISNVKAALDGPWPRAFIHPKSLAVTLGSRGSAAVAVSCPGCAGRTGMGMLRRNYHRTCMLQRASTPCHRIQDLGSATQQYQVERSTRTLPPSDPVFSSHGSGVMGLGRHREQQLVSSAGHTQ